MPSFLEATNTQVEHTDGRVARGVRTRSAIADALYALLVDGVDNPSGREIAERANVSLRSVFQHFEDIEAVYGELIERQHIRIAPYLIAVDKRLSLSERVERIVELRDAMYAFAAPLRRSVGTHRTARTSHTIRRAMLVLSRLQREQLVETFPKEISNNEQLLLQVDVSLSFDTWEQFVQQHGLSRAATRGHMSNLATTLLVQ